MTTPAKKATTKKGPTEEEPKEREWTLMFYFASDNPLAPGVVSQLKAIKQAGFHHDVNVIAHFDPQSEGTPTHIFDVNHVDKLVHTENRIGFIGKDGPDDPFVSNMIEDKLWRDEKSRDNNKNVRDLLIDLLKRKHGKVYNPPKPPPYRKVKENARLKDNKDGGPARGKKKETDNAGSGGKTSELGPQESLREFLKFCRENYPARHYILFILGHGVVVGNDVFLYDANADRQSLSLLELAEELKDFKGKLKKGAQFELVSFHSCSVSSLEVMYQLSNTANYMLASQGTAFVGSWPYRQILMRVFKDTKKWPEDEAGRRDMRAAIKDMLITIFYYCFHNSTDFLVAGYSFDLCLCDLNKAADIKAPLVKLSDALKAGLADPLLRDFILLAHWRAQSNWQESYTDLRDFCICLLKQCDEFNENVVKKIEQKYGEEAPQALGKMPKLLQDIKGACDEVEGLLEKEFVGKGDRKGGSLRVKEGDQLIVAAEFAGPGQQYSHGLSVYFPWSEPLEDNPMWKQYGEYAFNDKENGTKWLAFLEAYFEETMRETRKFEVAQLNKAKGKASLREPDKDAELAEDMASLVYIGGARLGGENALAENVPPGKVNPRDPLGDECSCASVKNHPRDTRARSKRRRIAFKERVKDKDSAKSERAEFFNEGQGISILSTTAE